METINSCIAKYNTRKKKHIQRLPHKITRFEYIGIRKIQHFHTVLHRISIFHHCMMCLYAIYISRYMRYFKYPILYMSVCVCVCIYFERAFEHIQPSSSSFRRQLHSQCIDNSGANRMHKRDEKHVYSFIDPFNHIVDAKKIIIQDD